MAARFPLTEARAKLTDIVSAAQYGGKVTIITRHGKDAAAVVPIVFFQVRNRDAKKIPLSFDRALERKTRA